jgi:hypothetical protein
MARVSTVPTVLGHHFELAPDAVRPMTACGVERDSAADGG